MREGRDRLATLMTPYGPIVKHIQLLDESNASIDLPIACPFASITYALEESLGLRRLFELQLLQRSSTPEDPWTIVSYCDEVTLGNVMAMLISRRFHGFYWSFIELGAAALSNEECWFTLMIECSTIVNSLKGGLSACFAAAVKSFFKEGMHMKHGGITLSLDGGDVKFFAELGAVLLDGGAHKYVWGARGDSASRFCILCKNLFSGESRVVDEDGSCLLRCDVINTSGLEPASDNDLRTNMRFLEQESSHLSVESFILLQQALGLTYYPGGVLVDRELDSLLQPTETYCHDFMHALFVDGVYLTFEKCIKDDGMLGVYGGFSDYLSHWCYLGS